MLLNYFVLPAIIAQEKRPMHPIVTGFTLVVFALIWYLTASFAVAAAASIYGFRTPQLGLLGKGLLPMARRPVAAIIGVALSYILTLYDFAVIYTAISTRNPHAFNQPMTFGSAVYFSVVTAATVGYGDFAPISPMARAAVVVEILLGFVYVSALFSVIAGLAWRNRSDKLDKR